MSLTLECSKAPNADCLKSFNVASLHNTTLQLSPKLQCLNIVMLNDEFLKAYQTKCYRHKWNLFIFLFIILSLVLFLPLHPQGHVAFHGGKYYKKQQKQAKKPANPVVIWITNFPSLIRIWV